MLNREDAATEIARVADEMKSDEKRLGELMSILPHDIRAQFVRIVDVKRPADDRPHHEMRELARSIADERRSAA